jgi:hypothetical protein
MTGAPLPAQPASAVRSLADDVRGRTDEQLRALVRLRPDLARPAPSDLTSLAARASTRSSVQRALDGLDRGHLQVLEALVVSGDPVDLARSATLLGRSEPSLEGFVRDLWDRALMWRGRDSQHVVRAVAEVLGPYPAGLGPAIADLRGSIPASYASPEALDDLIASAPPDARSILDRLTWGTTHRHVVARWPHGCGRAWLLSHQLISALSADHVVLPREVALRLAGAGCTVRAHCRSRLTVSGPTNSPRWMPPAGGQASEILGLVDELAADWGPRPPRVLRAGGLSARDFSIWLRSLTLTRGNAALIVETAYGRRSVG